MTVGAIRPVRAAEQYRIALTQAPRQVVQQEVAPGREGPRFAHLPRERADVDAERVVTSNPDIPEGPPYRLVEWISKRRGVTQKCSTVDQEGLDLHAAPGVDVEAVGTQPAIPGKKPLSVRPGHRLDVSGAAARIPRE